MGGHLERAHRQPSRLLPALALGDRELLALAGARRRPTLARGYASFSAEDWRGASATAAVRLVCRHHADYPSSLNDLDSPPAVLHAGGEPARLNAALSAPTAAIVGSRNPSPYGSDVAQALARGLGAAGVTVISGLAFGIDAAAHSGALAGGGPTVAVLAGGVDVPYPAGHRVLYERVARSAGVVSEMPVGYRAFRWCFLARNRIIAALADAVIVIEATPSSGSLLTAALARALGRRVGAVPGRVTASLASGPLGLLRAGADLVRNAEDALELACPLAATGPPRSAGASPPRLPGETNLSPGLPPHLRGLLQAISDGQDSAERLVSAGHSPAGVIRGLGELELLGHVRRTLDGTYTVVP
jgi:DNA processing protein